VEKASWATLYTSWVATVKNDLARHNVTLEDAIELALNKPLLETIGSKRSYALMVHAE